MEESCDDVEACVIMSKSEADCLFLVEVLECLPVDVLGFVRLVLV